MRYALIIILSLLVVKELAGEDKKIILSGVTFEKLDSIFGLDSPYTDYQKEEMWKDYRGKYVTWAGEVNYVSEGLLGGLSVGFKYKENTLSYDVLVSFRPEYKKDFLKVAKGVRVRYRARLDAYTGTILSYHLSDGHTPADYFSTETKVCTVLEVIDGDTIKLSNGEIVRYIGMDTAEIEEPFGNVAKEYNRRLVEGKTVRLEFDIKSRDKYGRLLAYVYVGDIFVNALLIQQGMAKAMTIPPDTRNQKYFEQLEIEAKESKRGLWRCLSEK